jgi:hypothetical protein
MITIARRGRSFSLARGVEMGESLVWNEELRCYLQVFFSQRGGTELACTNGFCITVHLHRTPPVPRTFMPKRASWITRPSLERK